MKSAYSSFYILLLGLAHCVVASTYTWEHVAIGGGGFFPSIIFNPTEKDLIFIRADIGGCYRWNEATQSWKQLMNWVPRSQWGYSGVESIATDPLETNRVYAAVGTYTSDWDPNPGAILISTTKGDAWDQIVPFPFKVGGNEAGRGMGERLQVDPNKNNILYFGTRGNGLWKSNDYGITWSQVESFPVVPDYEVDHKKIGVTWVTFDSTSSSAGTPTPIIYVGVAASASLPTIYSTTDAGLTWCPLENQPLGFFPHHGVLSSDGTLYITYSTDVGPSGGTDGAVWKFHPNTAAWTNITPPKAINEAANGFGGMSVDAANPQTLIVASLNLWWPDGMLWRTRDGGATWNPIWTSGTYPSRTLKYRLDVTDVPWLNFGVKEDPTSPAPAVRLGWWMEGLAIDPHNSDRIFWGTGATLYTTSSLSNWDRAVLIPVRPAVKGVEYTAVQDLISPPSGTPHLLSAIGDLVGFRHDDIKTVPQSIFTNPIFVTGRVIDYAELAPEILAMVGLDSNQKPAIGLSADQGATWTPGSLPAVINGPGSVAVAADGTAVVWAPYGGDGVYVSTNGTVWTKATGITTGTIHLAADRKNSHKIYALVDGKFYTSVDQGKTFTMTASLPTWGIQASKPVKTVPGVEGDIWISMGTAGLHRSADSGTTFVKAACCSAVYTVGFGKAAPGSTYPAIYTSAVLNGVDGIYRSDDRGVNWIRINDDGHQYADASSCITGDPRVYGRVYVCTNGYGIPVGRLDDELVEDSTPTDVTSASVIFAGNGLGIGWDDWSYGGNVIYNFAGPPKPVVGNSIIKATLEPYGAVSLRSKSALGTYKTFVAYISGNGANISVRVKATSSHVDGAAIRLTSTATTGTRCEKPISSTDFSPCKIDIGAFGANAWDRLEIINDQNADGMLYVSHLYLSTTATNALNLSTNSSPTDGKGGTETETQTGSGSGSGSMRLHLNVLSMVMSLSVSLLVPLVLL